MKTPTIVLLATVCLLVSLADLRAAPEKAPADPAAMTEQATPAKAPPAPPRRPPAMPDPATIPGAETRTATDFDLTDSGYVVKDGKWLGLAPEAEAGTVKTTIEVGKATRFLILFEAQPDERGAFPVEIQVGDTALNTRYIRPTTSKFPGTGMAQLRWRDVPIAEGDVIAITTRRGEGKGDARTDGRWSRVIFIPLDADPRAAMRGPPPGMVPPPPPRPAAKP